MRCSRRKHCSRTGVFQQDEDLSRSQSFSRTEWAAEAGGGVGRGGDGGGAGRALAYFVIVGVSPPARASMFP